ncbi:MAG: hypothetical protein M3N52_11575 [Actinomycetota bacterium]|nr:hypothetical protein [Actinomycetota bacterium]
MLIIDDAHLLDRRTSSAAVKATRWAPLLLAIVLLGQPTLRRIIRRGSYTAFDKRIAVRYYLDPSTPTRSPTTSLTTSPSLRLRIWGSSL